MQELIKQFDQEVEKFSQQVASFPSKRRNEKYFDQWSLKDILAHLSGWAIYQQQIISLFLDGHPGDSTVDIQTQNREAVTKREKMDWEETYTEWQKSVRALSSQYGSIPESMLDKSVFSNKSKTPFKLLQIEVNHLKDTHGPQLKKVLEHL